MTNFRAQPPRPLPLIECAQLVLIKYVGPDGSLGRPVYRSACAVTPARPAPGDSIVLPDGSTGTVTEVSVVPNEGQDVSEVTL